MAGMPGPIRVHNFSSAASVHAVETFDGDSDATATKGKVVSSKEMKKTAKKLLSPLKQKCHIPQASCRLRSGASSESAASMGMHNAVSESDAETFVSANNSKLSSLCTDDEGDDSELSSFRITPVIFPFGVLDQYRPDASPVKVVQKLPFGYVIGRKLDTDPAPPPYLTLITRKFKRMMAMLADLQLRSRWRMLKQKLVCARKDGFRQDSRPQSGDAGGSGEGDVDGWNDSGDHSDDDADAFWKKDVRGLRCRRVEDDDAAY